MSDDQPKLGGLDDLDWDSALDEWEKNTFVPEVARDAETNRIVLPLASESAPATEAELKAPAIDADIEAEASAPATVMPPPPPPTPPPPPMTPVPPSDFATRTPLPPAPRASTPSSPRISQRPSLRGGLDQLFSRPPRAASLPPDPPIPERFSPPPPPPITEATVPRLPSLRDRDDDSSQPMTKLLVPESSSPIVVADFDDDDDVPSAETAEGSLAPASLETTSNGDPEDEAAADPADVYASDMAYTGAFARIDPRVPLEDAIDAELARLPADDEMPTLARPSSIPARRRSVPPPPVASAEPSLDGERPASRWLSDAKTTALAGSIAWLEEETQAEADPTSRGRALLALSELSALVGDTDRAETFATEARGVAPHLPLAWYQARQLMAKDADALADALAAEAAKAPTSAARAHATLLAADLLRFSDRGDAAVEQWESACKLDPTDVRAPLARAALALAQDDHSASALRVSENSELAALDEAIRGALRLRGLERADAILPPMPINDGLRHVRSALAAGDIVKASQSAAEMAKVPELHQAALWLSATFGAVHIATRRNAARSLKQLANEGDAFARRQVAARGMELADPDLVSAALASGSAFDPSERAVLEALAHPDQSPPADVLGELANDSAYVPLVDALTALTPESNDEAAVLARSRMVSGDSQARTLVRLGRLLAGSVSPAAIDDALGAVSEPRSPSASGVALETAVRAKRFAELSDAWTKLPTGDDDAAAYQRHVVAALLAERASDYAKAKEAWAHAKDAAPFANDSLVRIAAEFDTDSDLGGALLAVADAMPDRFPAAILRLEGITRSELGDDVQAGLLERVHRASPSLGIAAFLAEHVARRRGDVDEVVRFIQERREYVTDPLESALDAVREALPIADHDADLAGARLDEARRARPDDVALRDLYDRIAPDAAPSNAEMWERRAESAPPHLAARLWLDAAAEHDRAGDVAAALRTAKKAAAAGDRGLSNPLVLRTRLETGETEELAQRFEAIARDADDEASRREALERLAELELVSRGDPAAALAVHRRLFAEVGRHKPTLRALEHALVTATKSDTEDAAPRAESDSELARVLEQIALALDGTGGGEPTAHAHHAARLFTRAALAAGEEPQAAADRGHDMARLAFTQPDASLWALRTLNAHARLRQDDAAWLDTSTALLERTQRTAERATLLVRASESALRLERVDAARAFAEQASSEDPGDIVAWGILADLRRRNGETAAAAEACESLARASAVPEHQLVAWHDAANIWFDIVKDNDRAIAALEAAAEIDVTYADVFPRLSALYVERKREADLARLLELRLRSVSDQDERVTLEVELARALADLGELKKAKANLDRALLERPDHTTALAAMADVCMAAEDWAGAEYVSIRLARLLSDPAEQRAIYEKLGEIYSVHAPNLARAEVAYKEVLKRAPGDPSVLAKLVGIYKQQGDIARAAEVQQEIIAATSDPDVKLGAMIELADIYETAGRDARKSERVLEAARKEFPTSVLVLRTMAAFYQRHRQMPAMQILLDRAAADARRAFARGQLSPPLFEVLHAAFELRGKHDAAKVVAATLAAVGGSRSALDGADANAVDPQLDDLLAPELMSPALRAVLSRTGDVLDAIANVDLRVLAAKPLPSGTSIGRTIGSVATVIGLGALQILVTPHLGRVALPISTTPPTLLVGEGLAREENEPARMFVVVRALKMLVARASAFLRGKPDDVPPLVAALFVALNPTFVPPSLDTKTVAELARRIVPALPKNLDATTGVLALEAAGAFGASWSRLGLAAHGWANRVALLAVGDPNAALDAIAWDHDEDAPPLSPDERAAWIARHEDARELLTFSVTDAYAEARARLALDR